MEGSEKEDMDKIHSITNKTFRGVENGSIHVSQYRGDTMSTIEIDTDETNRLIARDQTKMGKTLKNKITDNGTTIREASTGRKILIMTACLFLHVTASGISISLGVIYVDLIRIFNAPHAQAALVQSIFIGTLIGGGVLFTNVLQRVGSGVPVMIASLVSGIAFFVSSFATNVPMLIALIGVIGGLAMCINFLAAYVTIGWTFHSNRKFILGILTFGWTVGQIAFPYVSAYLIDQFRWNGSLIILSALILNCLPCGLLFLTSRQFFHIVKPEKANIRTIVLGCLKDYVFILYLIYYTFFLFLAPVETWFLVDLAIVKGFDRDLGTVLLSLLGIFSFTGRFIGTAFLRLCKRTDALIHVAYSIFIWGVAHYLVGYFDVLWGFIFAVVLRGLFTGISGAATPGSMIEIRGADVFPQTVAMCNFMGGVSQILGGLVGGATVDITGGYNFIFTLAAVVFFVCGILLIIIIVLMKRQRKRDPNRIIKFSNNREEETDSETTPLIKKKESPPNV